MRHTHCLGSFGSWPNRLEILLGINSESRFISEDGFLQIRGAISGWEAVIRDSEIVLGHRPFCLIGTLVRIDSFFVEADRFLKFRGHIFLTVTEGKSARCGAELQIS